MPSNSAVAKLEKTVKSLRKVDPRNAAEYAYAIAMLHKRDGNFDEAKKYAQMAIDLFDQCQMNTMEECAARNVVIEGVAIPDLVHQGVVRNRIKM